MQKIDISFRTIVFTVVFLLGLWFLYLIKGVLILWFIAFILMTALNSIVVALERFKIPRFLGILATFLIGIGILSLIIASLIPTLVEQTVTLTSYLSKQLPYPTNFTFNEDVLTSQIQTLSSSAMNLLKIVADAASNVLTVFSVIVLTVYLLLERQNLKHYLKLVFKDNNSEHKAEELIDAIEKRLGSWVRGEIILMFTIGVMTYIGLLLLGIPFAVPLAILAGLLELIPNIGPILSAVPAIIAGLTISPVVALGVAILYLAVQQTENHLIVPLVMKQSVGIKPLATLMALMIGATLGGIGGAILAIPFYITAEVIFKFIQKYRVKLPSPK